MLRTTFVVASAVTVAHAEIKRLYLIRHGESKWNQAEKILKSGNVVRGLWGMYAKGPDHPLNEVGIEQARRLNQKWKSFAIQDKDHKDDALQRFLNPNNKILSSPLTRALQTCLLAIQDHPAASQVTLYKEIREKKNRTGKDTRSETHGDDVKDRAKEQMESYLRDDSVQQEFLDGVFKPEVVSERVGDNWWTESRDTPAEMQIRRHNLLKFIKDSTDHDTFILSGHSLFWKELIIERASHFAWPKGQRNLAKHKMENGTCCYVDIDFTSQQPNDWQIIDIKPMFEQSATTTEVTTQFLKLGKCQLVNKKISLRKYKHKNIECLTLSYGNILKYTTKDKEVSLGKLIQDENNKYYEETRKRGEFDLKFTTKKGVYTFRYRMNEVYKWHVAKGLKSALDNIKETEHVDALELFRETVIDTTWRNISPELYHKADERSGNPGRRGRRLPVMDRLLDEIKSLSERYHS